ncbi:MAG TPA: chromate transporter [Dehalococcoidia bacterium]|nr:chromate transporter [Dehalococcoidia bacterium]
MSHARDLVDLVVLLVRTSFAAFGGGISVLPEIERVAVGQHHWLTAQEFADCYALGALTPGPGMLMVMGIGYKVAGVAGAFAAMLAMFLPVGGVAYVAGWRWDKLSHSAWRSALERGIAPVTVGLLLAGSWTLIRASVVDAATAAIVAVATVALLSRRVSPALIVLAGGLAGAVFAR